MKSITKLTLAGITTALFATGGAFANDAEGRTIDNHHGSVTYLSRPAQTPVTIAFAGHVKAAQSGTEKVKRVEARFHEVSTPHGTVNYFAPTE
ncbi:MAG: hypothetical protein WDN28_12315 [Chthoniobacter sp.]